MKKVLALSVSPTEALNVLNGKQSALLRKRVPKGYVGWCYGVVRKGKPYLYEIFDIHNRVFIVDGQDKGSWGDVINGKIPFRFWYEEVDTYKGFNPHDQVDYIISKEHLQALNTSLVDIWNYASNGGFKDLYAISITKLEVFDKPMELGEFYKYFEWKSPHDINDDWFGIDWNYCDKLTKSPSTYQYVWVKE